MAGLAVSGAFDTNGRAWLWGFGTNNQLGKGDDDGDEEAKSLLNPMAHFSTYISQGCTLSPELYLPANRMVCRLGPTERSGAIVTLGHWFCRCPMHWPKQSASTGARWCSSSLAGSTRCCSPSHERLRLRRLLSLRPPRSLRPRQWRQHRRMAEPPRQPPRKLLAQLKKLRHQPRKLSQ